MCFAEMKKVMRSLDHITWERLDREGTVTYPVPRRRRAGTNDLVWRTLSQPPTGARAWVPTHLLPPGEMPDQEYPIVLTTGRMLEHWHTGAMTSRATTLAHLEPTPIVGMNPYQMGEMGIGPGDHVRGFNPARRH